MRRALWLASVATVLAACGTAGSDQAALHPEHAETVAGLVAAHDRLVRFDADVEASPAAAAADWPEVERAIDDAVERSEATDGLDRQQRSALAGFRRGLEVAADAYRDVAAAAADDPGAAREALKPARRRLDALANLRDVLAVE